MAVTVKFFAQLREEQGQSELQLEISNETTVAQVWALACPNRLLSSRILMAVNKEYASSETQIYDGDEVAFFPPVTGG